MTVQFNTPVISTNTEEGRSFKAALNLLNEQLNIAFNSLELSNFATDTSAQLQAAIGASAKITQLTTEEAQKISDLKDKILNQATTTARAYEIATEANETAGTLTDTVAEYYTAMNENNETMAAYVDSQIEQTSRSVTTTFSRIEELTEATSDELTTYTTTQQTYIRSSEAGIEIGKMENGESVPYSVLIDNEKIAFLADGQTVSYVTYDCLNISRSEITDKISFGNAANGYMDIISDDDGIGFKWRETE